VGPEMPEGGSKTSTVPVVWATFGIFSVRSKWFPVGRDWWPWMKPSYVTMTRRQSNNQWSGGIAAHHALKKFRVQKSVGNVLASLSGIKKGSSSLIIFQRTKLSTRSFTHSAGAIKGHFEGKTCREGHQWSLVLARQFPASPGTCNPEETGLPGLPVLNTDPILRILPCWNSHWTLVWKSNWNVAIFRPRQMSFLARWPDRTDEFPNFFEQLAKFRATDWDVYWTSWEFVE
jgi:hypothetical protein